jgi:hypothetical protein
MASEFQDLGRLGEALLDLGEADTLQLAARTRLPLIRINELVERAVAVGLAVHRGDPIRLTPSGLAFASSLRELEVRARRSGHLRFRPFTDYTPARWSIE